MELGAGEAPADGGPGGEAEAAGSQDSKYAEVGEDEPDEDFLEQLPPLGLDVPAAVLLETYHALLAHLVQLRRSFQERYGQLDFDFGEIDEVQKLHSHMRLLAGSEDDIRRSALSGGGLLREVEGRVQFNAEIADDPEGRLATDVRKKALRGYNALRGVFGRLFRFLHALAAQGELGEARVPLQVERRAASGLSMAEFFEWYARPGRPVIITGLNITDREPWTLEYLRERCNASARLLRRNPKRRSWGRLEFAAELSVADFIGTFRSNATRRKWYLHDWGLPRGCPAAFGPPPFRGFKDRGAPQMGQSEHFLFGFIILCFLFANLGLPSKNSLRELLAQRPPLCLVSKVPRYFAGDYLQRAPFEQDQHTWPSLFVGSGETLSAMHVDSGGTNFWLYLLSGRKEWRLLRRSDMVNAYKDPESVKRAACAKGSASASAGFQEGKEHRLNEAWLARGVTSCWRRSRAPRGGSASIPCPRERERDFSLSLYKYICNIHIYIYIYMYICVYIYIYIYTGPDPEALPRGHFPAGHGEIPADAVCRGPPCSSSQRQTTHQTPPPRQD